MEAAVERFTDPDSMNDTPERGLIIAREWLDEILCSAKTLEIRSRNHSFAGQRVYLAEKSSGRVRGTAVLGSPRPPLTKEEERVNQAALEFTHYAAPTAWPLCEVARFKAPWLMSGAARTNSQPWVLRYRWERDPSDHPEDFSQLRTAVLVTGLAADAPANPIFVEEEELLHEPAVEVHDGGEADNEDTVVDYETMLEPFRSVNAGVPEKEEEGRPTRSRVVASSAAAATDVQEAAARASVRRRLRNKVVSPLEYEEHFLRNRGRTSSTAAAADAEEAGEGEVASTEDAQAAQPKRKRAKQTG